MNKLVFKDMNILKRIKLGWEWVMRDMARWSRVDLRLGSILRAADHCLGSLSLHLPWCEWLR